MTPEQENLLFESLGGIKEGITNLNKLLGTHTEQDMVQFQAATSAIQALDAKVDKLTSDFAIAAAVDEEKDKSTKKIAAVRAAWVAGAISVVGTLAQIFVPLMFK